MMKRFYPLLLTYSFLQTTGAQNTLSDTTVMTTFKIFASCDNLGRTFTKMERSNDRLNFILVNNTDSITYLVNCDTTFHDIWSKSFVSPADTSYIFSSFVRTPEGNKIAMGTCNVKVNSGGYKNKAGFVCFWNNNDSLLWSQVLHVSSNEISPQKIILLNNGHILCFFTVWLSMAPYSELVCLNQQGNLLWAKKEKVNGFLNGFTDEQQKNIYLASSKGYMLKLDEEGNILWSKLFSNIGPYYFLNTFPVNNNSIAVLDLFEDVMKLDTNGNFYWFSQPVITGKGSTSYSPISLCSLGDSGFVETILITTDDEWWSSYSYGVLSFDEDGNLKKSKSAFEPCNSLITFNGKAVSSGSNFLCGIDVNAPQSCFTWYDVNNITYNFQTPTIVDQTDLIDDTPDIKPFKPLILQPATV